MSSGQIQFGFCRRGEAPSSRVLGIEWAEVEQYHSDVVVPANPHLKERADALFTEVPELGLVIKTADCLPVLIASSAHVLAIHAGWRGIELGIINRAIERLVFEFPNQRISELSVWIGPHIRQASFEVGEDVAERLALAAKRAGADSNQIAKVVTSRPGSIKRWVDLEAIAVLQLKQSGIETSAISLNSVDTFTSLDYASFRRDGANAGRNLSFIARRSSLGG